MLTFDNMEHRSSHGTFDWRLQQIVLDVPDYAATINFGLTLAGAGQAWVGDFVFEVVDKRVKSTNVIQQPKPSGALSEERRRSLPEDAVNTDFEQPEESETTWLRRI